MSLSVRDLAFLVTAKQHHHSRRGLVLIDWESAGLYFKGYEAINVIGAIQ